MHKDGINPQAMHATLKLLQNDPSPDFALLGFDCCPAES